MISGNLFADAAVPTGGERFETRLSHRNPEIERIVSSSAAETSEYIQSQDEWVVLLKGEASLRLPGRTVALAVGDFVFLPAGTPHSVERVSEGAIWLAVHLHPD